MRVRNCLLGVVVAACGAAGTGWAQNPPPQIEGATLLTADPVEVSQYLGTAYKNETDGFRLTPPAGSRIVQRRGVDLISFIVDAKSWGGSLQRLNFQGDTKAATNTQPAYVIDRLQSQDPLTMAEMIANIKKELPKTFKGVEVLQEKVIKNFQGNNLAVRLDVAMQAELGTATGGLVQASPGRGAAPQPARGAQADVVVGIMRQQLIVQTQTDKDGKGTQFFFLTFYSPLKDRDAATKTFEAMLTEFTLFDPKTLYERRAKAVVAGKEWLGKHDAVEFIKKMNNQPQFFMQQVEKKNVGFIVLTETSKAAAPSGAMVDIERSGRRGALMTVKFGSFYDKAITYGQIEEFWGVSKDPKGQELGQYSEWNVITKSQIKEPLPATVKLAPGQLPYRLLTPWIQETGNIAQDSPSQRPRIIVTFGGDKQQQLPPGLHVVLPEGNPPAPLPKVLEYTWTRFVNLTTPSEMSFVTYDSRDNKLKTRNLIVTGELEGIKVNGKSMQAYKCIDEIDPNNTTLWVDKEGQIQLMKTSDQSIFQPTTPEVIDKTWPKRPTE